MEYTLLTGGTGFLGSALIPRLLAKGKNIIVLAHKKSVVLPKEVAVIEGDILKPNLGISGDFSYKVSGLVHMAAIHRLGEDRDGSIWQTNVEGTRNVIEFCIKNDIPHLYFTSTAYTQGRNVYERSKALCETMARESGIPQVTIFKPSIVMGTPQHFYPGHLAQFVALLVKVHQRAEVVRRKIEGAMRLPVIEPVFHMKANPGGRLNLVSIDDVTSAMATIDGVGTYWLTHPYPPTLGQLVEWVSESIMVRIVITPDFKPTPIEAAFEKMSQAFTPYLWGDNFPSDLKDLPPITKEFIQDTIKRTLIG